MIENIFTPEELANFDRIRDSNRSIEQCVCCFFTREEYILGNPSPSYGKIGTIAGKVEKDESLVKAIIRETNEEAMIRIDPANLGDSVISYEEIKGSLYKSHSFRSNLPKEFQPKLPTSDTNLEGLPILIHKDAISLMELYGFNPPNNSSLMSWALGIERVVLNCVEDSNDNQTKAFGDFLESLEESMRQINERGIILDQTIADQYRPKLEIKIKGVKDFQQKIQELRDIFN